MDDSTAPAFRALADPSRRLLLDRLFERDGQTLGELTAHLPEMTRFGVMRHLDVLEHAGLISTRKEGREKRHSCCVMMPPGRMEGVAPRRGPLGSIAITYGGARSLPSRQRGSVSSSTVRMRAASSARIVTATGSLLRPMKARCSSVILL